MMKKSFATMILGALLLTAPVASFAADPMSSSSTTVESSSKSTVSPTSPSAGVAAGASTESTTSVNKLESRESKKAISADGKEVDDKSSTEQSSSEKSFNIFSTQSKDVAPAQDAGSVPGSSLVSPTDSSAQQAVDPKKEAEKDPLKSY